MTVHFLYKLWCQGEPDVFLVHLSLSKEYE